MEYATVGTGDEVSLGDRTLRFLHTPFLHWPDTQCTYLVEEAVLFSGDVFGCHYCDNRLFNDRVGDFRFSFDYYYAHIMRPFKAHVMEALQADRAPAAQDHRPHPRPHPARAPAALCDPLPGAVHLQPGRPHRQRRERSLVVFYMSSYGNTARMAEAIRAGAEDVAGVRVSLYDLEGGEIDPFVDLIEEADALAFGSPTINGDAVKPVWDLLSSLAVVNLKGKLGAAFGSYGWSGEAVRMIEDRMRGLKMRVPVAGLRLKLIPTEEELGECRDFGRQLAAALVGRQEGRVIDFADLA